MASFFNSAWHRRVTASFHHVVCISRRSNQLWLIRRVCGRGRPVESSSAGGQTFQEFAALFASPPTFERVSILEVGIRSIQRVA
jgi:hypothetical protein